MMKSLTMLFVILSFSIPSFSAVKKKPIKYKRNAQAQVEVDKKNRMNQVKMALKLPLENRLSVLKKKSTFKTLRVLALHKEQPLHIRWRATTALGMLYKKKAVPVIVRALKSKKWFMRNSGLIAMYHADKRLALKWAKKLVNDKALVVRTAAVETIRKLNAVGAKRLLKKKMYSKENYNRSQGLWVRNSIMKTLVKFARPGDESFFVKVLSEDDPRLQKLAMFALERITKIEMGSENMETGKKVGLWKNWWASRNL